MKAAKDLGQAIGDQKAACEALAIPRASFYRFHGPEKPKREKPKPPLALTETEVKRKEPVPFFTNQRVCICHENF